MAEYSKTYSKDTAFTGDYPEGNDPSGAKQIKVGSKVYQYDESLEDGTSALPKDDILDLISAQHAEGLGIGITYVTDIGIFDGVLKKKTRTLTFVEGMLVEVSLESTWS